MCDERAAMRALLRDWGGSSRLLREMERQRVRAGRECDLALAELDRARARLNSTPNDTTLCAATGEAAEKAGEIAAAYARAYERLREQVGALEAASAWLDVYIRRLSKDEQTILRLRYVRRMGWTAIARTVYRSATNARYIERGAVDKLCAMRCKDERD